MLERDARQRQQDGLTEDEPVGPLKVLEHAGGEHPHSLDNGAHLHQQVVREQRQIRPDDTLDRRMGDVPFVPQGARNNKPSPRLEPYDGVVAGDELLNRVVTDPNICFGKPTIRGTRIWVGLVLGFMADGASVDEILQEYPQLTEDDIRACPAFAAHLINGRFVDVA
jgi:uncharacterized protein (DUF433 family)